MVVKIRAKMAQRKKLAWPLRSSQLLLAVERLVANDGWVTSRVKAVSRRRRGPQARLYRACHPAILDHRGRRLTPATLLPPPSMRGFTPPVTGTVGRTLAFRHDAFQSHVAGVDEHSRSVGLRDAVSRAQARIREAVIRNRQDKLTALLHHANIDVLRASFFGLKKTAAQGVDEMTWSGYAELGGSGRLDTRLDTPPSFNRRHPVSRIAQPEILPSSTQPFCLTSADGGTIAAMDLFGGAPCSNVPHGLLSEDRF